MTKPVEGTDAANEWEAAALDELLSFPLVDALFGRRSRRFFLGAVIPDGPLAHESRFAPFPLSELERLLIVSAVAGKTGWHSSITRHQRYAPHLSNYPVAAGGRTFPSAAGFHTSEVFFTDDSGTYFVRTRDIAPPTERQPDGLQDVPALVRAHAGQIERLSDARLHIPPHEPYMEGHNSWVANRPGTLLVFPVGDVAQHALLNLFFFAQNGFVIYDDINRRDIPGIERFRERVDVDNPYPLTFLDQYSLAEVTAELSTAAYAGALMQQALGLGGWMFNGIDRLTVLGASGDPAVPGLGFHYDSDPRWPMPNPTGLPTIFLLMYLQTHHLDLEYYDELFQPGAYLRTHAEHMEVWHGLRFQDLPKRRGPRT